MPKMLFIPKQSVSIKTLYLLLLVAVVVSHGVATAEELPQVLEHELAGKLVLIPAGEFMMGSPETDPDAGLSETPRHQVTIKKPFYMGAYEVTLGQFRRFVSDSGYITDAEKDGVGGWGYSNEKHDFERPPEKYSWRQTGFQQTSQSPVVNVSWRDATAYSRWLTMSEETHRFRLPTEAEWEYACRAGTKTIWNVGNNPTHLNNSDNIADASIRTLFSPGSAAYMRAEAWTDQHQFTAPVGSYRPNPFGLYDMHGNVLEWCLDIFEVDRYLKPDDYMAVLGKSRVIRGGSWNYAAASGRSARRHRFPPQERWCNIGFRVVRETVPASESAGRKLALVPLYRFYDRNLREHIYSYGLGEPPALRKRPEISGETIIGYVSLREERLTARLWRYVMPNKKHYFFFNVKNAKSPNRVGRKLRTELDKRAKIEDFVVWTWTRRSDKRLVPVYACSMPDGTDMLLSRDRNEIKRAIRDTSNSLGVKRHDFGVAFYVYPTDVTE